MPTSSPRRLALEPTSTLDCSPGTAQPTDQFNELEAVYRLEAPRLIRYFSRRIRESDEASDLVQEAFVRLADSMSKGTLSQPGPYLQRIARNLLFDRSKRLERRLSALLVPFGEGVDPGIKPDQAHGIEAADVMRAYRRALDELPEKTRQTFLLHRVDEMTYRDIGFQLGISIPTVQYHVARALAHIDAALEQE